LIASSRRMVVPEAGPLTLTPHDATARAAWSQGGRTTPRQPNVPGSPQMLNRYSYGLNNPVKYTDPTGHCIWDACLVEVSVVVVLVGGTLIAVSSSPNSGMRWGDYDWTNWSIPGFAPETGSSQQTANSSRAYAKPLQPDERKLIGQIDQIPDFLDEHPDLAEEAERVNQGETLPPGRNHVREAEDRARSLEKAIRTLQGVRRSRDAAGQREIDAAIGRARDYLRTLKGILSP
jgi:hypothetical protein